MEAVRERTKAAFLHLLGALEEMAEPTQRREGCTILTNLLLAQFEVEQAIEEYDKD